MLKAFRDNLKRLMWILWVVIAAFILLVFVDFGGRRLPPPGRHRPHRRHRRRRDHLHR